MIEYQIRQLPLVLEGRGDPFLVGAGVLQRRFRHLDVVEPHDRIDRIVGDLRAFAHHLTMDLALGRHVDHHVALDVGGAPESVSVEDRSAAAVVDLQPAGWSQCVRVGRHSRHGSLGDLATTADTPPPAYGVQVDAEVAGSVENGDASGDFAASSRRRERDGESAVFAVRRPVFAHAVAWRRRPWRRLTSPLASPGWRWLRIQAAQSRSLPVSTSAALMASMISGSRGLVIADVIPAPIVIARKAALMPDLLGRPKLMLDAPHVVLTLNSSRRRRMRCRTWRPAVGMAPIGITRGSTTTSE